MRRLFVLALLVAGSVITPHAQVNQVVDFSGLWTPVSRNQDGSGLTGDAAGVPLSPNGQWRAQSWSPDDFDTAEWVCRPHAYDYSLEGPRSWLRFWPVVAPATQTLTAYESHIEMMGQRATIWMDGRPHPPENAPHTWSGFTTGEWDGDVLVTTTTHLKEAYMRRTGVMRSDKATMRTRWRRIGNYIQATSVLYDPVYWAEPYVRSTMMWVYDPALVESPYPCEEATETAIPRGDVAHFLPGKSPLPGLNPKLADRFFTPIEARLGGPETMYPEFIAKIKTFPRPTEAAPAGAAEGGAP